MIALPWEVQEELDRDSIEKVKDYMDSVKELAFELRGQKIKVKILYSDIYEKAGGADLIYRYQLTH